MKQIVRSLSDIQRKMQHLQYDPVSLPKATLTSQTRIKLKMANMCCIKILQCQWMSRHLWPGICHIDMHYKCLCGTCEDWVWDIRGCIIHGWPGKPLCNLYVNILHNQNRHPSPPRMCSCPIGLEIWVQVYQCCVFEQCGQKQLCIHYSSFLFHY